MLNQIHIQGNLTKDPDYREFPSGGGSVCTMRIASSRKFKNSSTGQMQEKTTFVKVKAFGKLAQTCRQFLSKGSAVIFSGHLELDQWEKDGVQKQELFINAENLEFLPSRSEQRDNPPRQPHGGEYHHSGNPNNTYHSAPSDRGSYAPPPMPQGTGDIPQDDDIPF
jgi:single-strand DNA-binding protein